MAHHQDKGNWWICTYDDEEDNNDCDVTMKQTILRNKTIQHDAKNEGESNIIRV